MLERLLNAYRNGRTARNLDVIDVELDEQDWHRLRGDSLNIQAVGFRRANLKQIHWRHCRLTDVRLSEADLTEAIMRLCTMEGVQAEHANFSKCIIENASASGCTFRAANFTNASMIDSNFSRADLRNANLERVNASGADFRGADLRGARLVNADFSDTDLRGADLTSAETEGLVLRGADLRGALLDKAAVPEEPVATDDFSPAFQGLAVRIGPLVERLLCEGKTTGLLEAQSTDDLSEQLRRHLGTGAEESRLELDAAIDAMLRRTADTGIAPLLEALRQNTDTPPRAVADLLENLTLDLKLEPDATTEDLLVRLIKGLHHAPPDRH